jgi:hypothetical protein
VYLIGNKTKDGISGKCYELVSGKLVSIADMPTARVSFATCVARHFIITAGGLTQGETASRVVEWYNTTMNKWASLPSLPVACHGLSISVYNEHWLLAVGG